MIPRSEIQRLAAQAGVRMELQERDYALGCFLLGLSQTPAFADLLAFKGGTALRKMYFPAFRFSEDLDFTVLQPCEKVYLQELVADACRQTTALFGVRIEVVLWKQSRDIPGEEAYRARLAYVGPLGQPGADPARITLDLTHFERVVLPLATLPVMHFYSDVPQTSYCVSTYRLEEMLAEKLRALLRRSYPRDLYDVWYLLKYQAERLDHAAFGTALTEKFRYKGYEVGTPEDFLRLAQRPGMAEAWEASLRFLLTDLPSHDTVVVELEGLLERWLRC